MRKLSVTLPEIRHVIPYTNTLALLVEPVSNVIDRFDDECPMKLPVILIQVF
jgi:hypothetical protein